MNYNTEVTDYIETASKDQIDTLNSLRLLVHQTIPDITEAIKWGFPVFAKTKDFAYLRYAKKHITLGFYNIDKLVDPDQKLEGNGNTLRHIKIKNPTDFDAELIAQWLRAIAV